MPDTADSSDGRRKGNTESFVSKGAVREYGSRANEGLDSRERKAVDRYFDNRSATVLDLGCGTGRVTYPLHEMGFDVIGVDISEPMIAKAAAIFPQIDFWVGDAAQLGFDANTFDHAMFSYYGIDYIRPEQRRLQALREIRRVLKPEGILAFSSHNQWYAIPALLFDRSNFKNYFLGRDNLINLRSRYRHVKGAVENPETYFSNPKKQASQLESCGLKLVDIVGHNDTILKYFETAPHYIAKKPGER